VAVVDVKSGLSEPFMRNREPGPASAHKGDGGIERPVDCRFHPDGRSLYVLDFGAVSIRRNTMLSFARHRCPVARVSRSLKGAFVEQNAGETAVLFELDNASWETLIARAEKWLLNVQVIQTSFRKLVEDTLPKINDSSVHLYLEHCMRSPHGMRARSRTCCG
jgi:hypothetical protein